MNQFSTMADKLLNALARKIGDADTREKQAQADKKEAWEQVIDTFAEFGRDGSEGREMRFLATDGSTLAPYYKAGSAKLDEDALYKALRTRYPSGARLWNSITVKTTSVSSTLLEKAIQSGKIDAALVDECLIVGEPVLTRIRRPEWTEDDKQKAEVMRLVKEEPVGTT